MAVLLLPNGTNHLAFTYVAVVVVVAIKGTAQHTISFVLSDYRCLLCESQVCPGRYHCEFGRCEWSDSEFRLLL